MWVGTAQSYAACRGYLDALSVGYGDRTHELRYGSSEFFSLFDLKRDANTAPTAPSTREHLDLELDHQPWSATPVPTIPSIPTRGLASSIYPFVPPGPRLRQRDAWEGQRMSGVLRRGHKRPDNSHLET
jgi:hypothetical protein